MKVMTYQMFRKSGNQVHLMFVGKYKLFIHLGNQV